MKIGKYVKEDIDFKFTDDFYGNILLNLKSRVDIHDNVNSFTFNRLFGNNFNVNWVKRSIYERYEDNSIIAVASGNR